MLGTLSTGGRAPLHPRPAAGQPVPATSDPSHTTRTVARQPPGRSGHAAAHCPSLHRCHAAEPWPPVAETTTSSRSRPARPGRRGDSARPLCLATAHNRPARSREEALRRSPKGRRSTSSPGDQPHEDQEQHGALRVGVEQGHKAREGEDEFHPSGMLRRRARDWHQSSAPAEPRGLPTLAAQAQKPGAEARVPIWD